MLKTMQQMRVVQSQRIKTVLQITEQLMKSFNELENCHFEQQNNVQGELKKDMTQLQKKIIKETVSTRTIINILLKSLIIHKRL